MNTDEFRRSGHRLIDWIADYLDHVEQYPVMSQVKPGEVRSQLPAAPPVHGESFDVILRLSILRSFRARFITYNRTDFSDGPEKSILEHGNA